MTSRRFLFLFVIISAINLYVMHVSSMITYVDKLIIHLFMHELCSIERKKSLHLQVDVQNNYTLKLLSCWCSHKRLPVFRRLKKDCNKIFYIICFNVDEICGYIHVVDQTFLR